MERKVALITGAGKGIGRGIAHVLAGEGYDVALHYCGSAAGAHAEAELIRTASGRAETFQADLSSLQGVRSLYEQFRAKFDRLDLLVYNSGITICRPMKELTEADFDALNGVDWKGGFFTIQLFTELMKECGAHGSVAIITSNQAHMVFPGGSVYGSVKAALGQFTRYAAMELAPFGIRINAIAPGWTDTKDPRLGEQEVTFPLIPLRRWATTEEVGRLVAYLGSQWAGSITGTEILMDGGACLASKAQDFFG